MIEINKIYNESNCETIERMENNSVNCLVTSPPYWGLRDYGTKGQIGLEKTVEEYIEKLVNIFDLFMPKLTNDGTMWINLGDTYISKGGASRHKGYADPKYKNGRNGEHIEPHAYPQTFKPKSLANVPAMFQIEMCKRGWILRNEIIWRKPNAMPQSATDRFTVDFEKLFFFTKSEKYYFEQQLEPYDKPLDRWGGSFKKRAINEKLDENGMANANSLARSGRDMRPNENGRNKRAVWDINTEACPEAHFAVYPKELVRNCIQAGCPVGGMVYDPFMGSGTTGIVALELSRNYVGSELNPDYITISDKRIMPYKDQFKLFDMQAKNSA